MQDKDLISREHFFRATGYVPEDDDLARSNCRYAGTPLHLTCGWDYVQDLPNFYGKFYLDCDFAALLKKERGPGG